MLQLTCQEPFVYEDLETNTYVAVYACSAYKRPENYRFTVKKKLEGRSSFVEARRVPLVEKQLPAQLKFDVLYDCAFSPNLFQNTYIL